MKNCRTSESLAIIILMTYSPLLFLAVTIAWTLLIILDSPTFVHDKIDEDSFEGWLMKQNNLKLKIKEVCQKYGKSLRKVIPMDEFIYDSKHNLLLCRNAKAIITHLSLEEGPWASSKDRCVYFEMYYINFSV